MVRMVLCVCYSSQFYYGCLQFIYAEVLAVVFNRILTSKVMMSIFVVNFFESHFLGLKSSV